MSTRRLSRTLALGIALYTVPGCFGANDDRRALVELRCDDGCEARWDGSDEWSQVIDATELDGLQELDPGEMWQCEPDPDADACAVVDDHGHRGCFRVEGAWAVAVAPACAVEGWLDVGGGMSARTSD